MPGGLFAFGEGGLPTRASPSNWSPKRKEEASAFARGVGTRRFQAVKPIDLALGSSHFYNLAVSRRRIMGAGKVRVVVGDQRFA